MLQYHTQNWCQTNLKYHKGNYFHLYVIKDLVQGKNIFKKFKLIWNVSKYFK